jgi:predicted DNA-binding transcriptional regulator YafY
MPEDGWAYGYILSYGHFVEVLEPDRLRKIIKESAEKIAKAYE